MTIGYRTPRRASRGTLEASSRLQSDPQSRVLPPPGTCFCSLPSTHPSTRTSIRLDSHCGWLNFLSPVTCRPCECLRTSLQTEPTGSRDRYSQYCPRTQSFRGRRNFGLRLHGNLHVCWHPYSHGVERSGRRHRTSPVNHVESHFAVATCAASCGHLYLSRGERR